MRNKIEESKAATSMRPMKPTLATKYNSSAATPAPTSPRKAKQTMLVRGLPANKMTGMAMKSTIPERTVTLHAPPARVAPTTKAMPPARVTYIHPYEKRREAINKLVYRPKSAGQA